MQTIILEALLIALAGFFKAVNDTVIDHFDTSIFKWKDRRFWDNNYSWKEAHLLKFTKFKLDARHLAASGMIVCFCLALAIHKPILQWYYEVIIAGLIFNLVFNTFYNKILKAKK